MRSVEKKSDVNLLWFAMLSCVFCLTTLPANTALAQNTPVHTSSGLEFQLYPAGYTGTARLTYPFGTHITATFHVGFNVTDRRDWGEHDDETGSGIGVGAALRYYFKEEGSGFHAGARSDLWFMDIEWRQSRQIGLTHIVIFQPTGHFGYTFVPKNSPLVFDFTVAFGVEINIQTQGEPVGEGPILLGNIGVGYRFGS